MKVRELIERLEKSDQDGDVFISMVSPQYGTETHGIDRVREAVRRDLRSTYGGTHRIDTILEWIY